MEQSALAIERRLAGHSAQPEGVLRISCADWFACYVLAPVLNELGRRYPLIVPEVIAGRRLFDLARRDADIAFRIVPFTEPVIVHRKLTRSEGRRVGEEGSRPVSSRCQRSH